jgi:hypothetical protein
VAIVRSVQAVKIADCVHHCAFRYGRGELNPYENYIVGLANGVPKDELRARFVEFVRHYRPKDVGEALGVRTERSIPLWLLPWKSWRKLLRPGGWCATPAEVVDLMTQFSAGGILAAHIEREYFWLERAWDNIGKYGYRPEQHSYITVFELRGERESRYVVLDGNHRLSSLAARGESQVLVRRVRWDKAVRGRARLWPLVLSGHVSHGDAMRVFDAYFHGNAKRQRSDDPAPIVG